MTYKNGRVPRVALRSIETVLLRRSTKADYKQMRKRAAQAGHTIRIINKWSGYRDIALQQAMIAHPAAYDVARGVTMAAAGHSTHGLGTAVDIIATTASGEAWLRKNCHHWRFERTLAASDPNHYQHT